MAKDKELKKAKKEVIENLETIDSLLDRCVNEGMIDEGSVYHNEIVDLLDDAHIVKTWVELSEIITLAKTLENEVDAWISIRGGSSLSLEWPSKEEL